MNEKQFKALSIEQRKAIQKNLQDAGHYTGALDGVWGATTESALQLEDKANANRETAATAKEEKARADRLREIELETARETARSNAAIAEANAKREGASAEVQNAETLAKTARKQEYNNQADSLPGMMAQFGATGGATAAGIGGGALAGMGVNALMDKGQRSANETLRATADSRVAGLTTRDAAKTAARLAGAMPRETAAGRVVTRMAPQAVLGSVLAGKGALLLSQEGEDDPFYPKMANRGLGIGMIGGGIGLAERGVHQAVAPGVRPDANAISIIESNQLRRNNQAPEDAGPKLTPRQALVAEAKAAGITKGVAKMNMTTLAEKLVEAKRAGPAALTKLPGLAGPGLAAALAYGMSPDSAEAATPGAPPHSATAQALTNAAAAGGTAYGINKAVGALPAVLGKAAGAGLSIANPGAMASIMDSDQFSPAEDARAQAAGNNTYNTMARYAPAVSRALGGEPRQALDMAQVPEPSPVPRTERLQTAAALQIPEGIPMPRPDGQSPYPEMRDQPRQPMAQASALQIPDNIPPNAARDAEMAAAQPQQQARGMPDIQKQIRILQQHGVEPDLIQAYIAAQTPAQTAAVQ